MKQAVHFGGGNIGRGFIGEILHDNGFSITFVDVNDAMIDRINRDHKYLIEIYDDIKVEKLIRNVSAVNSRINPEAVSKAILDSDIVTCSVGPNNLKYIAKNIADGISSRYTNHIKEKLDVIACENMVGASQALKAEVYKYLDDEIKLFTELYIGFPNASVDRIVPNIKYDSITTVGVEAYKEWIVETKYSKTYTDFKLEHVKYVSDIQPYTERKLLSVNTGHAAIA